MRDFLVFSAYIFPIKIKLLDLSYIIFKFHNDFRISAPKFKTCIEIWKPTAMNRKKELCQCNWNLKRINKFFYENVYFV